MAQGSVLRGERAHDGSRVPRGILRLFLFLIRGPPKASAGNLVSGKRLACVEIHGEPVSRQDAKTRRGRILECGGLRPARRGGTPLWIEQTAETAIFTPSRRYGRKEVFWRGNLSAVAEAPSCPSSRGKESENESRNQKEQEPPQGYGGQEGGGGRNEVGGPKSEVQTAE